MEITMYEQFLSNLAWQIGKKNHGEKCFYLILQSRKNIASKNFFRSKLSSIEQLRYVPWKMHGFVVLFCFGKGSVIHLPISFSVASLTLS